MSFRNVCSFTKFAGPILPDPSTTNTKSAFCKHPEKKKRINLHNYSDLF